jgi:hypothetical protein
MELNDPLNPTLIRWLIVAAGADSECIALLVHDKLEKKIPRSKAAEWAKIDWGQ